MTVVIIVRRALLAATCLAMLWVGTEQNIQSTQTGVGNEKNAVLANKWNAHFCCQNTFSIYFISTENGKVISTILVSLFYPSMSFSQNDATLSLGVTAK